MKMKQIVVALSLATLAASVSAADVVTGKNSMTLYSFDKDSNGKSSCYNQCATIWPPAAVSDASGKDFGETVRTDGSKQLTYKGKPMYYYINDKKAGDKTGDNVGNTWHVVNPTAKTSDAGGHNTGTSSYSY
jgi:predicted lipoprotein with Yx(FWY)xxD motif